MVAAMTVSMAAGCGSKSEGEKSSGSDSEVIKIGAIGPVTGAAAVYGQAVKNGAELAVEEINAAGTTVLVVTHNSEIVNAMRKRVITLKKGVIVSDEEEGVYIDED